MDVPGSAGWSFYGDNTIAFAKHPRQFVETRINQYGSKIFVDRVLNTSTIFVTTNQGVKEILRDKQEAFKLGYKDLGYMHSLYNNAIIFSDDDIGVCQLRSVMTSIFSPNSCKLSDLEAIFEEYLGKLDGRVCGDMYQVFKSFVSAFTLNLFLGCDWHSNSPELASVQQLVTKHWHGLISVPVSVKVPLYQSSYSKAMHAKEKLTEIVRNSETFNNNLVDEEVNAESVNTCKFSKEDEAVDNYLLFVSALIPKALASLLTSFAITVASSENDTLRERATNDDSFLKDVLLEVQRLWPPFFGGRRTSLMDVTIDGHLIPADSSVAFLSYYANRDETVFQDADKFWPGRWASVDADKRDLVWTFGGGKRLCVGLDLVDHILVFVARKLLKQYNWSCDDGAPVYKTLPVIRPKDAVKMSFIAL